MKHWRFTQIPVALALLVLNGIVFGQDGPSREFGPTVTRRFAPGGPNQKVLVIYVQASDYQILPSELAELNKTMDETREKVSQWFRETTYNKLTVELIPQRQRNGEWYTLAGSLFDYVHPKLAQSIQARNVAIATTENPTPAASVTAIAAPPSTGRRFGPGGAGTYRYAVSTFREGRESQLTKLANPIDIANGDTVTLTITRAAADDAHRYLIYRTVKGEPDVDSNYFRIGEEDVTGPTVTFTDDGIDHDEKGDFDNLVTDAMEKARPHIPNYDTFNGILVVIFAPFIRGEAKRYTFETGGKEIIIWAAFLSSHEDVGFGRYAHEIGHWLGLPDLYDEKTGCPFATWDTMDCACDGQYQAWLKDYLLGYLANPANVLELRRPASGKPDFDQDFIIHPTEIADTFPDRQTALKIKASDTIHYYIEGRRSRIAKNTSDQETPPENILITKAIDVLDVDIWPRRNVRHLAQLEPGGAFSPAEEGDAVQITFTSINNRGGDESYNVHVKLRARPQPDLRITPWSPPPWESPDIWVDSEREGGGFQNPATATPLRGNGEKPWVNHVNRVWARITNVGDSPAKNVTVRFRVAPGGMGDAGQFVDLPTPASLDLAPHESKMVFVPWTPTETSHTCIKVEIGQVDDETDLYTNFAQENIHHFYTGSASPWHDVVIPMEVANPFPETKRVDIQVDGLPAGWRAKVEHGWVMLEPRGRKSVQAIITPPPDAPECTEATLNIYAQTRVGDFTQPYGGFTPVIHLANPIKFRNSIDKLPGPIRPGEPSYILSGCTTPAQRNTEIAIQLEGPAGQTTVEFVTTDAGGCFRKIITFPHGGDWNLRTYFAGSKCNAPTESEPMPVTVPQGLLARGLWFGFQLGHNFSFGSLRKTNSSGPSVTADLEYAYRDNRSLNSRLRYHYFNGKAPGDRDLSYTNISLSTRSYFPVSTWRGYTQAGFGVYIPNFGPTKVGLNFGTGLNFPIQPKLALELGTDFHFVDPWGTKRVFADPRLGIKFRF